MADVAPLSEVAGQGIANIANVYQLELGRLPLEKIRLQDIFMSCVGPHRDKLSLRPVVNPDEATL